MFKKIFRVLTLAVILSVLIGVFASCKTDGDSFDDSSEPTSDTETAFVSESVSESESESESEAETEIETENETETETQNAETLPIIILPDPDVEVRDTYCETPYIEEIEGVNYFDITEKEFFELYDMDSVLAKIPDNYYETYPANEKIPTSATLYYNGQIIKIDANDPRLIKLINFYYNEKYHREVIYTTGCIDIESYQNMVSSEPRMELTFTPRVVGGDDRMLICNSIYNAGCEFYLIKSQTSCCGQPYSVRMVTPLCCNVNWLEVFGFLT